jgi:hypothetical protein
LLQETARAKRAWSDYLALGPGRSLEKLIDRYEAVRRVSIGKASVPTTCLRTLEEWSSAFGWQARLKAIADTEAKAAEEREAAYRRSIMEDGYALAHERVKLLKDLVVKVRDDLATSGLWVQKQKIIGSGKNAQVVTEEQFNDNELDMIRKLLDDLAREKSERAGAVKQDVNVDGKLAIQIVPWAPKDPSNTE